MNTVTAEQIRELDRRAMEEYGIPGAVLMENAGRAVLDAATAAFGPFAGKRIALFCGPGNNGGDGFVLYRLLDLAGAEVTLFLAFDPEAATLKPDAAAHWRSISGYAQPVLLRDDNSTPEASQPPHRFDLVIDALLGTGVTNAPHGRIAAGIRAINRLDCPVVAVDVPSGMDADSGATPGEVVSADLTVTFAYPKIGLFLFPGAEYVGRLHVADIGFPWRRLQPDDSVSVLGAGAIPTCGFTFSPSLAAPLGWEPLLLPRKAESNKGDYGHVGIIAGSRGMVGAPALTARAAQRSGAGLVTVLTAASAQPVLATKLDEQMTVALPERGGSIAGDAWDAIARFAEKATALCVGPGLTTADETVALVHRILQEIDRPIVLDADGLNALALSPEIAALRRAKLQSCLLLTPHPGEAARLMGTSIADVQSNRLYAAKELARRYHAIVVLKGRHSLIAEPGGRIRINTTGNPGMATGGMGDTLTGIVGALAGNRTAIERTIAAIPNVNSSDAADARPAATRYQMAAWHTAALAVHLHGIAGDLAAEEHGETGLTAGDVIHRIPDAFSHIMHTR